MSEKNLPALLELAERCEKAEGPDRELDAEIAMAVRHAPAQAEHEGNCAGWLKAPNIAFGVTKSASYTASLDAALTLVPEGWEWALYGTMAGCLPEAQLETEAMRQLPGFQPISATAATPALALCAASLRARAAGGQ